MGRGEALSDYERGQIDELIIAGQSDADIAVQIGRSANMVRNCRLRGPEKPPGKSSGRKRKLDDRDVRHIVDEASKPGASAGSIKSTLGLEVSHSTILRAIKSSKHLTYQKLLKKPRLTQAQKQTRWDFARKHITWTYQWHFVIFSDEKRFNLDGPDGCTLYWHDLRHEERSFFTRQGGGQSVMIWCAISRMHRSPIVVIEGALNADRYIQLLSKYLRPLRQQLLHEVGSDPIFQQDNAPAHVAGQTRDWLDRQGITYMDWPPNSPDLNPIENVFGLLVKAVYAGNRQFLSIADLTLQIRQCWATLDQNQIANIIDSMHNRMLEAFQEIGGSTHY
jgi:transposase